MKKNLKSNAFKISILVIYDVLSVFISAYLSLLIIELNITSPFYNYLLFFSIGLSVFSVLTFAFLRLYRGLWKYAGIVEFLKVICGCLFILICNIIVIISLDYILPVTWALVFTMLQITFALIGRFFRRLINFSKKFNDVIIKNPNGKSRVMIVGAGDAGLQIMKEMIDSKYLSMIPLVFVDDDPNKIGGYIYNVRVEGNRDDIPRLCSKYMIDMILIAMPSASPKEISQIISICQDTKCIIKTLPGLYQFVNGSLLNSVRDVEVGDLLGREQIVVNLEEINGYISNQVVLVTGGGGSIGSELCRQIAKSKPKQLIIFDIYENNAYDIEQEIKYNYPDLDLVVLIGSVRDNAKVEWLFDTYHPNIVYHAAAHKHVPLMETSPNEAIKNNVFGTLNVARACDKFNARRMILISTDKAVNPTNIMGATKRICEMIVQTINRHSKCDFVAVRFGNVLGSNGSVIPLFKKQIAHGGPVTVTHKDIIRFFMTIPEAVSLVLQAGGYANGGEIFVLDMGEPVKIYDLAVNLIRLSGYTPNVDIKIVCTGLRPGEKLYEEILIKGNDLQKTPNKLIYIEKPIDFDEENFFKHLDELYVEAYNNCDHMKQLVSELVPTYHITDNK